MTKLLNTEAAKWATIVAVGAAAVWLIGRKTATEATEAAAEVVTGIVTGDNALTKDTPYEGAGILGTLGSAFNKASGGIFQRWGEALGGWTYDLLHGDEDARRLSEQEAILQSWREANKP